MCTKNTDTKQDFSWTKFGYWVFMRKLCLFCCDIIYIRFLEFVNWINHFPKMFHFIRVSVSWENSNSITAFIIPCIILCYMFVHWFLLCFVVWFNYCWFCHHGVVMIKLPENDVFVIYAFLARVSEKGNEFSPISNHWTLMAKC